MNKHSEFPQIEVIKKVPDKDNVKDRFVTEGKQYGKRFLLALFLWFFRCFPLPVTAIEVLDMQAAGELRPESHIVFEGGAKIQDGVSSIVLHRVKKRAQTERFTDCRRNHGFSRSTRSHGMLRRKFSLRAVSRRCIRPYPQFYPVLAPDVTEASLQ